MKVLSLFDGVSCARLALERAGVKVSEYFASEIDKYAIKVTQANRPDTVQLGSVTDIWWDCGHPDCNPEEIDLLIGGSPCQDLSIAKKDRQGLEGSRSSLFYEYVRLLNEVKPKYFILENVASMRKADQDTISKELFGIEPVMINASLVSAQNRKRLFWVGKLVGDTYEQVKIKQPKDKHIYLKDILESDVDEKYNINITLKTGLKGLCQLNKKAKTLTSTMYKGYGNDGCSMVRIGQIGKGGQGDRIYSLEGKSVSLSALGGGRGAKTGLYLQDEQIRKLTPIECERLQGMPDNWTNPTGDISNTQRYKMCGNAFNVDVVAHIIKQLDL
jgi:DNA (cytosine-5)-methyltransferase 3A